MSSCHIFLPLEKSFVWNFHKNTKNGRKILEFRLEVV